MDAENPQHLNDHELEKLISAKKNQHAREMEPLMLEAERRKKEAEERFRAEQLEKARVLVDLMEHGRNSCGDDPWKNGMTYEDQPSPRCEKCYVILALRENRWPDGLELEITLKPHAR